MHLKSSPNRQVPGYRVQNNIFETTQVFRKNVSSTGYQNILKLAMNIGISKLEGDVEADKHSSVSS